ncbi:radical SAM protein [Candidatus Omnitrophota bacterium]
MELSKYSIIVNNHPKEHEHLVYNTRTQALVKINEELLNFIKTAPLSNKNLIEKYNDELSSLNQMGILVKNETEEKNRCEHFFEQIKHETGSKCFHLTILTTMACNFNCVYCFEKNADSQGHMQISTCELLVKWVKNQPLEEYEEIYVTFYGGEPLLNTIAIDYLTIYLKMFCDTHHLRFRFCFQTNGYLLKEEMINRYKQLGLEQIRISLDGVEEDHDKNRPLKNGGKTFATIANNIDALINKTKIGISSSYQNDDIAHIKKLIHYFKKKGILQKLDRFIFSPIHSIVGKNGAQKIYNKNDCPRTCKDDHLILASKQIHAFMKEKNLPTKSGLAINMCGLARDKGSLTIAPDGKIYKCNSLVGHSQFSVGNIADHKLNDKNLEFINLNVWKKCPQTCPYLPMCGGGCQLFSYLEHESFGKENCQKKYLDALVPTFIKSEYEKLSSAKNDVS